MLKRLLIVSEVVGVGLCMSSGYCATSPSSGATRTVWSYTRSELNEHFLHEGRCKECGLEMDLNNIKRHYFEVHFSNDSLRDCMHCGGSFESVVEWFNHMSYRIPRFNTKSRTRRLFFVDQAELDKCIEALKGLARRLKETKTNATSMKCQWCTLHTTPSKLIEHVRQQHSINYYVVCELCGYVHRNSEYPAHKGKPICIKRQNLKRRSRCKGQSRKNS